MMRRVYARQLIALLAIGCGSGSPAPVPPAPVDAGASDGATDGAAGRLFLTVNELPDYLNGSISYRQSDGVPHPFRVRVNRADFTLDVQEATGFAVDWSTLAVRCDQPISLPGRMPVAPGAPLPGELYRRGLTDGSRQIHFTEPALPDGATVTCQASAGVAESNALTFLAGTLTPALDPFPAIDSWLVILSRDLFRLEATTAPDGTRRFTSIHLPQGNGEPDFDEPLYELGLFSRKAPEVTRVVKARLLADVRRMAHRIFGLREDGLPGPDGVPLRLWFEGDPSAPAATDYPAGTFSMIALGGDGTPEDQAASLVGRAEIDWNNRVRNDNSVYGRGVYPTGIVRQALANPLSLVLLGAILPGKGLPIGESPQDAQMVAAGFDPAGAGEVVQARHRLYTMVMRLLAVALASTLCHEIGHSLGLVPSGPPPLGLFAEVPMLSFTVKESMGPHIDTPGLNVEQTGASTNWMDALNEEPRFNGLSLAYLRRRLVVGAP